MDFDSGAALVLEADYFVECVVSDVLGEVFQAAICAKAMLAIEFNGHLVIDRRIGDKNIISVANGA